jgi:membrane-associated protein
MDVIGSLLDFVFHIDAHLATFVRAYGTWVYALLFAIIFVETGVVVMPFLPGDSLLFVVGAMCAVGLMSLPVVLLLLWAAAVLGNQSNYAIGRAIGPRVFSWENSRWFNKRAFDQAHAFYERYGGITIVVARFMPFLRTFAPFVAGVAQMTRSRFTSTTSPAARSGSARSRSRATCSATSRGSRSTSTRSSGARSSSPGCSSSPGRGARG